MPVKKGCLVAVLLSASLGSACATTGLAPVTVTRGEGLMTVRVLPVAEVTAVCHGEALACAYAQDGGIVQVFRLPPATWGIQQAELVKLATVVAHEGCHGVHQTILAVWDTLGLYADLSRVPAEIIGKYRDDPCHRDGGRDGSVVGGR